MNKVAEYWDKFVGSHLNSPDHWEANKVVQQTQWSYITGDPFKNPLHWFYERYGPFSNMASICSGSGLLERDIAINYLQNNAGFITGYDISPVSIQIASESCRGLRGVKFEVKDINVDTLSFESFDAIFAHGALHHVEKLDHCLGELRNALKPTGFLYVNDYVGPRRFQWTDVQFRLAQDLLELVPAEFLRNKVVVRTDPVALEMMDPSEAVRSDHIVQTIQAHFNIVVLSKRGGTLLMPIFGSGCIAPEIFETREGMEIIQRLCELERDLIDKGIVSSDNVLIVATPRN